MIETADWNLAKGLVEVTQKVLDVEKHQESLEVPYFQA
jgi:hypothetical protein